MKDSKLVRVTIESPDGDARIALRQLPLNRQLELAALHEKAQKNGATSEETRRLYELTALTVCEVEGIERFDGQPITVEDIKNLDISLDTLLMIVNAAGQARSKAEPDEKKAGGDVSSVA